MTRPSNRELKVLSHLGEDNVLRADDFKDVGEKTFARMLEKGWIAEAEAGGYRATPRGLRVHMEEMAYGRWKR